MKLNSKQKNKNKLSVDEVTDEDVVDLLMIVDDNVISVYGGGSDLQPR